MVLVGQEPGQGRGATLLSPARRGGIQHRQLLGDAGKQGCSVKEWMDDGKQPLLKQTRGYVGDSKLVTTVWLKL